MQPMCSRRWVPIKYLKVPSSLPIAFRGIHACTVRIPGVNPGWGSRASRCFKGQEWIQHRLACFFWRLSWLFLLNLCRDNTWMPWHISHSPFAMTTGWTKSKRGKAAPAPPCKAGMPTASSSRCQCVSGSPGSCQWLPDSMVTAVSHVSNPSEKMLFHWNCRPIWGGKQLLNFSDKTWNHHKSPTSLVAMWRWNLFPKLCNTGEAHKLPLVFSWTVLGKTTVHQNAKLFRPG